ncbi:hypothetical protein R3P38DRAFT_2413701, partial [Favolaschia claudopus]
CVDITNGTTTPGTKLQIYACTPGQGNANQHFSITSDKHIQWANQNECLDLTDGSLASGNPIQVW